MARVSPEKRPDLFVALLAHLKRAQVPFEAWVAGEGRELAAMKSLALDAGVSDDVKFLGCVPRVGDLLAAAAVLVVCSDVEGLPNSVLEAQLAGCPVVATAVGGVPELIADGMTGFLVRRGDVEALAARVSAILSDRPLSQKLVSAAREHVAQYLSQDRMIGEVLAIYDLATNAEPSTHPDPSCP
jgi:glycosyltransferase involved in cell wall biosynthesis